MSITIKYESANMHSLLSDYIIMTTYDIKIYLEYCDMINSLHGNLVKNLRFCKVCH